MTLRLDKYVSGAWSAVNLEAERVCKFRYSLGYSHPAQLSFCIKQAQHTTPIPAYAGVRFWEEGALDSEGEPFTAANPLFLGFVEAIQPKSSNELEYTCFDPTARAASKIPIMSTEWASASAPGSGAVPRLIFNSNIDNDDDYTFCRDFNLSVGQMIAIILEDAQFPLEAVFAAPSGSPAYESSDLDGLDFQPQEKIVFTGEPVRSGIMRLIDDWEPEWRMVFYPGSRKWRFGNIGLSPQVTVTLNDFTATHPVLKLQMDRSLENRYTAVRIYGPEAVENVTATLDGGGLIAATDGPVLETYGAGAIVRGQYAWQIADDTKWRMGRLLATPVEIGAEEFRIGPNVWTQSVFETRSPTLLVQYKANNAGTNAWQAVAGVWRYDHTTGILTFGNTYIYRFNPYPQVEGGILQPSIENPEDVMLIYPSYINPLEVRKPATGYEGTAYSVHGLENELAIYDPSLAVGYLFGTPVTSATKIAKFEVLAQKILDSKKDVLYHGGMTLQGIDYAYHLLDRRVNVEGVDHNGATVTTGWEAIKAIVTDCEYDFEEMTTTLNFNSDHSELLGFDPERIKQQLRIGAEFISQLVNTWTRFDYFRTHTELGTPLLAQSMTVGGSVQPVIIDPFFGTMEAPIV